MKKTAEKKAISVIAELTVTSSLGKEVIRGFDHAWQRVWEVPVPATISLNGFVRKDENGSN